MYYKFIACKNKMYDNTVAQGMGGRNCGNTAVTFLHYIWSGIIIFEGTLTKGIYCKS